MKIVEFISYLQNLGVKLWIEQEQLGCDAPKGVITPELKQNLIDRKTEIIEFLCQGYKTQEQFIKQVPRDGKFPLSFAQERLWFLNQLFPNNPAYNLPIVLTIDGTLNVVALEQSLNAIIQRHETLRTTFSDINGKPVQIVAPATDVKLPVVDLQNNYSPQEQSEKVQQLVRHEAMALFDLAKRPMLRVTLLRLDPERYMLLITMHHIICDLWSLGILVKELSSFYAAFSQGKNSVLPELPIQYADFAYWQRERFAREVPEKQLNYWKKQLAGVSPVLKLPTDYPHPAQPTFKGGSKSFQIGLDLTRKLRQLTQESESTLFMTLLSVFFVLLSRYSGQLDLVVGSPIANRNRGETESLIGMFVNTLVLRADLSDNPTFKKLLNQVRETTLEAYTHQDFPFEKLVEKLNLERNLSHNPLVQVAIALQNTKMESWNLPGLRVNQTLDSDFTRFDLEVHLMEVSSGLEVYCNYSRDIFEPDTIDRMMKHFQILLEAVVTHPEQRVLQLPIMTEVELNQILVEWNDTKTDYPTDKCIHQLFEEQVEKTPDAVAVIFEEEQLTYQQLNCQANQLAQYLQSLGVKPEVLVGICVERSVEMVIGLLGILKAGGAYVPLDPSYPAARLSYILADAAVPILVTTKSVLSDLPQNSAKVFCLDRDLETVPSSQESTVNEVRSQPTPNPSQEGKSEVISCFGNGDLSNSPKTFHRSSRGFRPNYFDNPGIEVTPDNLAYVIYTSGSTGQPKGVLISHQNVTRLFRTTESIYNFNPHDCSTLFHSYAFDFSVWELWGALLYGGRLVIVPYWVSRSPKEFYDLLVQHQVTVLNQTPSAFAQIIQVDSGYSADALKLRYVIFGGETLQIKTLVPWFKRHGDRSPQLINMYGITETTVHVTYQILTKDNIEQVSSPIGKALGDLKIYILDRYLQPVPIGVTGELHIGGAGLARGYLNRPELTAERFIPNPFENNSKLYKTGDLARYLPDGNLEYIGRIDNQVKVRGYRIETGEIESTITQHPSVKQTVVVAREDNSGNKILVAYLVVESETPERSQTEQIGKLKHYLKERLPEYMIPSWFVVLPQLPLTPNGKVDRKALPVPNVASSVSTEYVAPQTETQKVLAEIWQEVLGVEKVSIHDNFFDLGGHSLMATQVVSRVRQTFDIELPLTKLFENSELVSLSQEIEVYLAQSQRIETLAIQPREENENPPPLSYPQQRLWFLEKMALSSNAYNQPLTLHLVGKVDYVALQTSINQIIARHETLRTTFSEINGTPVQIIKPHFELQLPIQNLSELTASEQTAKLQQLLQQENEQTFNLEVNPPIRAQLYQLGTTEHILQITLHHIASDGWSLTVLFQELSAIYTAILEDQPFPLPPLPIQYADFAVWQRNYLQGETLETQLNYWKQKLQDLSQLQLPTDHLRPPVQTFNGAGIPINIPAAVTSKVKQLSKKQGTTLFITLLAVFKVLLSRYSGQQNIAIGTPIANRNRREIEGLIGFFVNSLVMYTDLGGEPNFTEVLNRVKQTALEAYDRQDIPFDKLVEELQPERVLSQNPLFQVMFAVQQEEIFKSSFNLPNLELSWYEGTGAEMTVRMDMELHLWAAEAEIKGFCAYNRDLFETETISRMLSDYQNLLSAAVETPEQPISQLPLMTEAKGEQILVELNNTIKDYSANKFIHQLFEEQAKKTSDVVAVVPDSISVSREYVAPQTQTQKVLAEIWQEVLGIEKVGIHDNFFDLGGHSLTAVKLASKISTNFNISLSIKTLFLHPIIAELSNIITESLKNKNVSQQQSYQSINNEVQETLNEQVLQTKKSEYLQLTSRSLLSLFAVGKIPPVDAVALGYLAEYDAKMFDFSRDYIIENIFENLPFWVMVKQTNWGRIAIIILPRFISDLYSNQDNTVQVIIEALEMARIIGAKFVSLTGLIPSATDYGLAITKAIANRQDLPKITTGHRTTGAAIVLTIKKICDEGGRDLSTEKVGFIGLGSVGMNVLPLILKCLPHPQEITLCDVYSKLEFLENIQQDLVEKFGFKGQINLALSKTTVPEQIYNSTLIVGATNIADVLDIMQVKPGTLIVDDSSPHCFSVEQAIHRFQEQEDILFSEGGMLRSPSPIKTTVYLPPTVEKIMNKAQKAAVFNSNPFNIMGCVFSSLLSSKFEQLKPTVGICDGEQSQLHYQILQELKFEAGNLHCEHYVLPAKSIANFRQRFGKDL